MSTSAPAAAKVGGCPYQGLVPFDEADWPYFFGRGRDIRIIALALQSSRLTVLYGQSGVGKTSLLQAGVMHRLRAMVGADRRTRERLRFPDEESARATFAACLVRQWRDTPLPALASAMHRAVVEATGDQDVPQWTPGTPLVDAVRTWSVGVRTFLVLLDQFEDYFLYHPERSLDGGFADALVELLRTPGLSVHVLVSIRQDALALLDRFDRALPELLDNRLVLGHLDRASAERAIRGPLEKYNEGREQSVEIADELVTALLNSSELRVGQTLLERREVVRVAGPDGTPASDRIEAPLLQLVLTRLWDAEIATGSRKLQKETLNGLGGPKVIAKRHLESALEEPAISRRQQELAAELFQHLVSASRTKFVQSLPDLIALTRRPENQVRTLVEKLVHADRRILRLVEPASSAPDAPRRVEIFHDILADPILEWRAGIEARVEQRTRSRQRLRRILTAMTLSVLTTLVVLAVVAIRESLNASHARDRAESAGLIANALLALPTQVDLAVLLGLEAVRKGTTPNAEAAVRSIVGTTPLRRTLRGHSGHVLTVAFSPDGRRVASGGADGTLRLWDPVAGRSLRLLRGHDVPPYVLPVYALAFSGDGRKLASAGGDGTIRLWEPGTGRLLRTLRSGTSNFAIAFSPNGSSLASAGGDGTLRLWDTSNGRQRILRGHEGEVRAVAFSPDGRTLASGGSDGTLSLWNPLSGRRLHALRGAEGDVLAVAFSPDGSILVTAGGTAKLLLWDPLAGRRLRSYVAPTKAYALAFSPNGRTLASGGFDGTMRLWDLAEGRILRALRGHQGEARALAFSPDGRTLVSGGFDGTLRLWDPEGLHTLGDHEGEVRGLAFSPDGRMLASVGLDNTLRLWDPSAARRARTVRTRDEDGIAAVAFSPDGATLATGSLDGTLSLWDSAARRPLRRLKAHDDGITVVAFSPVGGRLATGGLDGMLRLWDSAGKRLLRTLVVRTKLYALAFGPEGRMLAGAGQDGTIRLYNPATGRLVRTLVVVPVTAGGRAQANNAVYALAFSTDGRMLASAELDGRLRLWDPATGHLLRTLRADTDAITALAFTPDGRTIATGGFDGTLRLWDPAAGLSLRVLEGHQGEVRAVAFSPNGAILASGGADGKVGLLDCIECGSIAQVTVVLEGLQARDSTPEERLQYGIE